MSRHVCTCTSDSRFVKNLEVNPIAPHFSHVNFDVKGVTYSRGNTACKYEASVRWFSSNGYVCDCFVV